MGCLIGAITFFNQTKGEQSYITFPGLVSTKIDVWLNGKAFNPVFNKMGCNPNYKTGVINTALHHQTLATQVMAA